ncbi:hypothetical protein QCA50_011471 [Cerrena zonata]|uniref:Uncharacterized protein n=1 Tax=Cerrena zonata TaxID=2478898 RepID=A0AAW0G1P9_9APHY
MATIVTLTIKNELGKTATPSEEFTLIPSNDKTFLTAGKVITQPSNVPNQTAPTPNNGGIYQATVTPAKVRGIASYLLLDDQNQLVIFFNLGTARIITAAKSLTIDDQLVQKAEETGTQNVKGSFVRGNVVYTYQIIVNTNLSEDGKTLNCSLTATNTY